MPQQLLVIMFVGVVAALGLCDDTSDDKAGKLERFEQVFERSEEEHEADDRPRRRRKTRREQESDASLVELGLLAWFYWPAWVLHDDLARIDFGAYPYGEKGDTSVIASPKGYGLRFDSAYQFIAENMRGVRSTVCVRTSARIGGRVSWTGYEEGLDTGEDHLDLVSVMGFHTSAGDNVLIDSGVGVKWILGREERWGPQLGLSLDWFLRKPLAISATIEWANVDGEWFGDYSAGLGFLWEHLEGRIGYRTIRAGGEDISGFEVGLRLWF